MFRWLGEVTSALCSAEQVRGVVSSAVQGAAGVAAPVAVRALQQHFGGSLPRLGQGIQDGFDHTLKTLELALSGGAGLLRGKDVKDAERWLSARVLDGFFQANPQADHQAFRASAAASCRRLRTRSKELLRLDVPPNVLAEGFARGLIGGGDSLAERLGDVLGGDDAALLQLANTQGGLEPIVVTGVTQYVHEHAEELGLSGYLTLQTLEEVKRDLELLGVEAEAGRRELLERQERLLLELEQYERCCRGVHEHMETLLEDLGRQIERGVRQLSAGQEALGEGQLLLQESVKRVETLLAFMVQGILVRPQDLSQSRAASLPESERRRLGRELAGVVEDAGDGVSPVLLLQASRSLHALDRAEDALRAVELAGRQPEADREQVAFNRFQLQLASGRADKASEALREVLSYEGELSPFPAHDYPFVRVLGWGGMGVTFLCRALSGRDVVLKTFFQVRGADLKERLREATAVETVRDPRVVRLRHCGYVEGNLERPYMVMELAPGVDGEAWRREAQEGLDSGRVAQVGAELAEALVRCHSQDVFHRDVKPSNVMIDEVDGRLRAVTLIDFGLARVGPPVLSAQQSREAFSGSGWVGTPDFAPRDQSDPRKTDVFGLGATLLYWLTGKRPGLFRLSSKLRDWEELLHDMLEEEAQARPNMESVVERLWELVPEGVPRLTGPVVAQAPRPRSPRRAGHVMGKEEAIERVSGLDDFTPLGEESFECGGLTSSVPLYRHDDTELVFCLVPGGVFMVGGTRLKIEPFLLCQTPCTERAYALGLAGVYHGEGGDLPVGEVSWEEARNWCEDLDLCVEWELKEGERHRGLLSEVQWEWACRAGNTGAYCFGDSKSELEHYAWFKGNSGGRRGPVLPISGGGEGKRPNAWGLYHMHGSVWEWCEDHWQSDMKLQGNSGQPDLSAGASGRVCRGGSWGASAFSCRSAYRSGNSPGGRGGDLGFRPARSLP